MSPQISYREKYKILEKINETNYARVFRVVDAHNNISVLKIARTRDALNNDLITREYTILSQTKHPHIVKAFDYDLNEDGRVYFTLEYIKGQPINVYFTGFSTYVAAARCK